MLINKILRVLLYWPIRLTASCVPVPLEPLKDIDIDLKKPIVYLTVSSSIGNLLTIERLTKKLGLPSPFSPLEIDGQTGRRLIYLRRPRFFKGKANLINLEPIFKQWIDMAHSGNTDIQILPVTVLWSRNPSYEGISLMGINYPTPIWRKFLKLIFSGRDNATIVSAPFSLNQLYDRVVQSDYPTLMRRFFELFFLRTARSVVGQPLPNRKQVITDLLKRPIVIAAIEQEQQRTKLPHEQIQKQAQDIYDEMVSDMRYPMINLFNKLIHLFWKKMFRGQVVVGGERVRQLVQSGHEIIYIPCHRSHMDYLLSSYVIYHEGLPFPQTASGNNLNFFPVGGLIRRLGSYFIRRTMKGDNFYITLFAQYLSLLFERGYATEFFIEGGRSRTGRTLPPKTGMVAMAVEAQLRGLQRPIAFIPTYLGYEHVSEVRSYMSELGGQNKKKENAWQLLGIFKRFRFYGRGYVTFGDPVIVPKYLSQNVPNWKNSIDSTGLNTRPQWLFSTVNSMARQIIVNLNDVATINGINLCALAIISEKNHTLSMGLLRSCLHLYLTLLQVSSPNRHLPEESVSTLIKQALELNKFHVYDVGDEVKIVRPSRGQTLQLTYFKNNIVHLFALPALLANIIIRNGHILRSEVRTHARHLFYFLRHELYCNVQEHELDAQIENLIDCFIKQEYITQSGGMLYLSGDNYEEFNILSRCIHLNLIRYLVAVTALLHTPDDTLNRHQFVKKCINYASRLPGDVTDHSPEFADAILFNIMCDTFIRHNYFSVNADMTIKIDIQKVMKLVKAAEPLLGARDVKILNGQPSNNRRGVNRRPSQQTADQTIPEECKNENPNA